MLRKFTMSSFKSDQRLLSSFFLLAWCYPCFPKTKMKALRWLKENYLFGAARGFISRVEIDNHRLPFEFGEGYSLPILIFQCKGWWHLPFVHLEKKKKNTHLTKSIKGEKYIYIFSSVKQMYLSKNRSLHWRRGWDWVRTSEMREFEAIKLGLWRFGQNMEVLIRWGFGFLSGE